ncbi:amino acid ABC transporter substrate-binding protein, PAAT family [Roseovarius pacificus]|uniref:Amino acid ABC transporter substrate-binding protein, PAAT family n=2 Tax=Roseovarius pacificus TaxID=337701 RepID=A0A1M7BD21_9RHOB|nr:ABC transporter substrate-binding protein [Roseovarius pacificus]GGO54930.1 ABC transporter substrate-binding protein [Roseovarius pacificus]SHL52821.1 amino acid ABC transporter substrate-binding protein, PAAT family [Roseovarius pacificus]
MKHLMKKYMRTGVMAIAATVTMIGLSPAVSAQDVVEEARAALSQEILDRGTISVATNFNWPPFDYMSEEGEPTGIEVDLIRVIGAKLGLEVEFNDMKFPSIMPGVSSSRFDVGMNQFNITPERLKTLDFLPYFESGYGLLVPEGNASIDVNNLCGKTLVITQGSYYISYIEEMSKACTDAGNPEVGMKVFQSAAETMLALSNSRGDGFITASAVGTYVAQQNPGLELSSGRIEGRQDLVGFMIRKGSDLDKAMLIALESAVDDGSYLEVLEKYGVSEGAIGLETMRSLADNS